MLWGYQMINVSEIYRHIRIQIPDNNLVIAYSGGLDSHVLLHVLSLFPNSRHEVRAIHVDHGLQKGSEGWAQHCVKTCEALGMKLDVISLNLKIPNGESLEEVARRERYQAFHQSLKVNESLLTAHHQNDQVETFLLNLFRGAGVEGLASMPISRMFGPKGSERQLVRPLLSKSRASLEAYAKQHQLDVVEDPSNLDKSYDRNFLRRHIIPEIRTRWPGIEKSVSRTVSIQSEAREVLNEVAANELQHVYDPIKNALSISKLKRLTKAKQKLVLRYWIADRGFSYPSEKKLQHLFSDVIEADEDTQPLLEWQGVQLRRFQDNLYISESLLVHDPNMVINWDGKSPLTIDSLNITLLPEILPTGSRNVTVRFRQGGEKIRIPKRGNLSLKNIFQEQGIPPWMRDRMPLLFVEDELLRIVGLDLE